MSKKVEPLEYQDEETHDKLMEAFREYFKANTKWIEKGTRISGENARYWLAQIRIIARDRRDKIQRYRVHKDQVKAQKQGTTKDTDAN